MTAKLQWAAPERKKAPILDVLRRVLPARGTLLEIASGTGQHAAHFAAELPSWTFVPSDIEPANLQSIAAWRDETRLENLRPALRLDVCDAEWPLPPLDAIYNANLLHIAPWACAEGLLTGAARYLRPGGVLVLYGPYRIDGGHTAPSNERFDEELRQRDPRYGVRNLEDVVALAQSLGLTLRERVAMPANNQTLIFERGTTA